LKKLEAHAVDDRTCKWIGNCLKDRKQKVVIAGESSDEVDVLSGVPQGSVLGPTLFTIFINDLDHYVSSQLVKFADDTKVYRRLKNPQSGEMLQQDINNLCRWSKEWKMTFNVDKCSVMHIGFNNPQNEYEMDGKKLKSTDKEKDLGIYISKDLKPSNHCTAAVKKANQWLGIMRRNIESRSPNVLLRLY
jgi:hypothetical protein